MACLITAIVMTLSILEGHSPIARLYKSDILYLWHIVSHVLWSFASVEVLLITYQD